ncbi:MAG: hypothetical protein LBR30_02135 [Clostridioides sp.]|nr:hypothetical protein [Clostridioides sp.]
MVMRDQLKLFRGQLKSNKEKFLKIIIYINKGEKITLKLPFAFAKNLIENNIFEIIKGVDEGIDLEKVYRLILNALENNLEGEIITYQRKNKDIVRIIII